MRNKPNILIFMTDHQRRETMPGYGWCHTPALQAFAQDAMQFDNAACPAPHCCPSRASFFTGLYPSEHGVWNNVEVGNALSRGLARGVKLWSEDLSENGYRLYYAGKWHVSSEEGPQDRGFEVLFDNKSYTGIPRADEARVPLADEWAIYEKRALSNPAAPRESGEIQRVGYPRYFLYGTDESPYNDREITDISVRHIQSKLSGSQEPWCLYIGPTGPHDPYRVPQRFLDLYDPDAIRLPDNYRDAMRDKPALYRRTRERYDQLTDAEHREALRHYLAFCSYEDALFGEVCDALKKTGQYDDTLILYLSDHGDYAGAHGLWAKGLPCFGEAYAIPLMIHMPGGRAGRCDAPVCLTDIAPTLLELCGIPPARRMQGRSLAGILRGEGVDAALRARPHFTQSNGNEIYGIQRSVCDGRWKYVFNSFDYDELYDLENDPGELCNLAGDARFESVIYALSKQLWRFAKENNDTIVNPYIMTALAPCGPGILREDG